VHSSDTHEETMLIATLILNRNSLVNLNNTAWTSPGQRRRSQDTGSARRQAQLAELQDCAGQVNPRKSARAQPAMRVVNLLT
jgi:hypothetical protein